MQPGQFRVSGLPLHLRPVDGSIEAHPCGEILVDATAARHLRQRGITPLLSVRDQDGIEVRDLQGLNGLPLRGPWTERP
jgi:type VI secretion system protein ImpC